MSFTHDTSAAQIAERVGAAQGLTDIDGNTIYFEAAGKGPALLFLHDGLLHHRGWDEQFAYFADWFTVIRYDRPGYGNSAPPASPYSHVRMLHGLYAFLAIEQALLMGGSAGGRIAIDFTLAHPDLVRGLVLVGAVVSGYAFTDHMWNRGWKQPWPETPEAWLDFWINDPWLIAEANAAARQRARDLLTASPQNLKQFDVPRHDDGSALRRLSEIGVPTLIIIGESDIADNHAHAGVLETGIQAAERVIVTNAGHLPYLEQPQAFNQLVQDFVQRKQLY